MRNVYIIIVTVVLFVSCNTSKKIIEIKQIKSEFPLQIWCNSDKNTIREIDIPLTYEIYNYSKSEIKLRNCWYIYKNIKNFPKYWQTHIYPFLYENEQLLSTTNPMDRSIINANTMRKYVVYTRHFIDSANVIQTMFKDEIENMKLNNIDSLSYNTKNNNELLQRLMYGDSISFKIWVSEKNAAQWDSLPVEVK